MEITLCFVVYFRYTQPPADLWDWFEPYIDDEEVSVLTTTSTLTFFPS